jgi:hypothetical protein
MGSPGSVLPNTHACQHEFAIPLQRESTGDVIRKCGATLMWCWVCDFTWWMEDGPLELAVPLPDEPTPAALVPGPHGTPVRDNFNRADEDPVSGGLWVSDFGDFHIVNGALVEAGGNSTISWVGDFPVPVEWFWTIAEVGTATDPQLYPQIVFDSNNRYELDYFGRSAWQTYEKVNGVWSNPDELRRCQPTDVVSPGRRRVADED